MKPEPWMLQALSGKDPDFVLDLLHDAQNIYMCSFSFTKSATAYTMEWIWIFAPDDLHRFIL